MSDPIRILLVDDEQTARYGMRRTLEPGSQVAEADRLDVALKQLTDVRPDLVLLDLNLGGDNGLDLLTKTREMEPPLPLVIIITAHGSEKVAVEAMKAGAYDYLAKPFEIDDLRLVVRNASERIRLERENRRLRLELEESSGFGSLVGRSEPMRKVFSLIDKVAPADVTVLITGESGSGKELVAREIHRRSPRSGERLVTVNCAALPEHLIESELFGHEKGAFTGALQRRIGKFEEAGGGTIFLDEIGDMPPGTQAKILRLLEERQVERLGSNHPIQIEARFISATNQDLQSLTEDGRFRSDLFYRLEVIRIDMPALRHRKEDIPLLAEYFLKQFSRKHGKEPVRVTIEAMACLATYDFPGNVRQLRNLIERLVVLAGTDPITVSDLPVEIRTFDPSASLAGEAGGLTRLLELDYRSAREAFERTYLLSKLRENGNNITHTAEAIGTHRQSLQQKIRDLDLKKYL